MENENKANVAKAEFRMVNPNEYNVKCVIKENNSELLHVEFTVGSREIAKNFCEAFKGNEMDFYQRMLAEINNFMEK